MEYQIQKLKCNRDHLSVYGVAYIPLGECETYPTVIIGHGFTGTYQDNLNYADYFARRGIASYSFDFCGGSNWSKSDGKTTEMSIVTETADMEAVLDFILEQDFVDAKRLFLLGESQGGFVAALTAAKRREQVAGLMLLYPAFMIPDNGRLKYRTPEQIPDEMTIWDMRLGKNYYGDVWDLDIYTEISAFAKPVLIFHGTADELVPLSYSRRAEACYANAQLVVMEGLGHGFFGEQALPAAEKMMEFMEHIG